MRTFLEKGRGRERKFSVEGDVMPRSGVWMSCLWVWGFVGMEGRVGRGRVGRENVGMCSVDGKCGF